MKRNVILAAAISLLVAAFWVCRTQDYEFLHLDDPHYVSDNAYVQAGFTWEGVEWATTGNCKSGEFWHPMTWFSLMADAELAPHGDLMALSRVTHLHNAVLQGLCAGLLFLLIMTLLGEGRQEPALPVLLTLVWALHPLRAECVCWVTERKEVLCAFYSLVTLLVWSGRMRYRRLLALGALACALLAKSVAVTLPVLIIALDLVRTKDWRRLLRENALVYAGMFALCAGVVLATFVSQTAAIEGKQGLATLHIRLANGCGAYAVHLARIVWPQGLYFYRQFLDHVDWAAFVPGALLWFAMAAAVVVFLLRPVRRTSPLSLGFLAAAWVGVGLLPMCGILRVGIERDPDRYGNWIGVGVTVLVALALVRHLSPRAKRVAAAVLVPLTLLCGYAGWTYAGVFRNNYELFVRTLTYESDHPTALTELAYEFLTRFDDRDAAIECYERALVLEEDDNAGAMLVSLLSSRGRPEDHRRIREICARVDADHSLDDRGAALTALGVVHMHAREWPEAISCFRDAIDRQRNDEKLGGDPRPVEENRLRLAMCHCNAKQYEEAGTIVRELRTATLPQVRAEAQRVERFLESRDCGTGESAK